MFALSRILERATLVTGNDLAVVDGELRMTYLELHARVAALAGGLRALGLESQDRVATFARNGFRYLELNLACAMAGVILVPLNVRLAERELDRIMASAGVKALFSSLPIEASACVTIDWPDGAAIGADCAYERLVAGAVPLYAPAQVAADDIAQIFFTSGTTGEPKGVCLTNTNLVASALDSIEALDLERSDIWLHASPMFHLVDAFAVWAISLVGGRHVFAHFEPATFAALVRSQKVTKTSLPPTLIDMILHHGDGDDLPSLERISYGGAPMPEDVHRRWLDTYTCPLVQAYGITEIGGLACQQKPDDYDGVTDPRRKNVGFPALSIDLRVIDDAQRPLPCGEIGEIVIAGARVMKGYWQRQDLTEAAIPDGWYRTGDLGFLDHAGHLTIAGRKKDMIITGGENVYPSEVEDVLSVHHDVAEAAVFGLPSKQWGEEVRALVHLRTGASVTGEDLIEHCRKYLGGYKVPKRIDLTFDDLPKNGPGKLAKSVIREAYLKELAE